MTVLDRNQVSNSLREFKRRRDNLLHEDAAEMEHHLRRFVEFCDADELIQRAIQNMAEMDTESWWKKLEGEWFRRGVESWVFPNSPNEEMGLRYALLKDIAYGKQNLHNFGDAIGVFRSPDLQQRFLSLIARPFCEYLSDRAAELANIPSQEARALQAVPLNRIPSEKEIRIFLSHRTPDKELVRRYLQVLSELGFKPWFDVQDMPAGTNLDRGILQGFKESCAAVFLLPRILGMSDLSKTKLTTPKCKSARKGRSSQLSPCVSTRMQLSPICSSSIHTSISTTKWMACIRLFEHYQSNWDRFVGKQK